MIPRCDCVDKVNAQLKARGMGEELSLAFYPDGKGDITATPIIETVRGKTTLIPNFCPFCGKSYLSDTLHLKATSKEKRT